MEAQAAQAVVAVVAVVEEESLIVLLTVDGYNSFLRWEKLLHQAFLVALEGFVLLGFRAVIRASRAAQALWRCGVVHRAEGISAL